MLGQEGEADVDIGQRVPLDQPAQAERQGIAATLDQEEPKPVIRIQPLRTFCNVAPCVVEIVHSPVADEPQPGGFIDEAENEGRVRRVEPAQPQAIRFCLDDRFGHGRIVPRSASPA